MTLNLYTVIRERAGDGTLFEVADIRGRVVSASPRNWRSAHALAEFLDADREMENMQLNATERD
jgi:hypothetical protein